jgi:hypothetical protein
VVMPAKMNICTACISCQQPVSVARLKCDDGLEDEIRNLATII